MTSRRSAGLLLSNVSPLTPSHHSPALKWPNVRGGTAAVALVSIVRAVPTVVLVPLVLGATDALARDRLLRLVVWGRVVFLVVASALVISGASPALIYLLAAVDAVASALLRPLRA